MRELQIGRVYRHFKGDYYLAEGIAQDSESAGSVSSTGSSMATADCGFVRWKCF